MQCFIGIIGADSNRIWNPSRLHRHEAARTQRRVKLSSRSDSRRTKPYCMGGDSVSLSGGVAVESISIPLEKESFFRIQNGSDVRGVSAKLDPEEPVNFTPELAFEIAASFTVWLAAKLEKDPVALTIAVGRDSRITGPMLAQAILEGIQSVGARAVDCGMATTPAMFMSTITPNYDYEGSMMITASHLPPNRNGMKFFTKEGGTAKTDVKEILQLAYDSTMQRGFFQFDASSSKMDRVEKVNFMAEYERQLRELIQKGCSHPDNYEKPLTGFRIVVDAGNGAGGYFARNVLAPLGADISGSQFLDPDGMFPNHVPNPEDKKAMSMTVEATIRNQADLGIIFDTDVDRSGVVDSEGNGINRNLLIALLASVVLREHPGTTILTDSVTSNGLKTFIERLGGKHFRYRRGYKNVIDKGVELNLAGEECWLAIETSGHGAMRENYMLDDGAYLAVKIVIEMVRLRLNGEKRGVAALLDALEQPEDEAEFRLRLRDPESIDFKTTANSILEEFRVFAESGPEGWTLEAVNYEGYRVSIDEGDGKRGWVLLRKSLHDPLLPMNVESERPGGVKPIVRTLVDNFFSSRARIVDLEPLLACLEG